MKDLFLFADATRNHPDVEAWMEELSGELGAITREWFAEMKDCGDDVNELLHDGHPTACVGEAAFAYVNAFKAHVNVGFFRGAELRDPEKLLEGTGRLMRHVKIKAGVRVESAALRRLIRDAYLDMQRRIRSTPKAGSGGDA